MERDKEYYINLRKKCLLMKSNQLSCGQDMIKHIYPFIRKYKLELEGTENIPNDSNVVFLVNHSNSHDIFTAYEVLSILQRRGSAMVATDCLSPITTGIFNISNATLLDRRNKDDRSKSLLNFSSKILSGNDGVIFGEGTWNIHPTRPMHNIRTGAVQTSLIASVPVVPTIFEYIEEEGLFNSENELYKKCVIRFGKPIMISNCDKLVNETNLLKEEMVSLRTGIWNDYGYVKDMNSINKIEYINHTYLKKFKALGFTYDSKKEQEFLLFLENEAKENEYTFDNEGNFVPGITNKGCDLSKVLRK